MAAMIQDLTAEVVTPALEANTWVYWRLVGSWAGAELHDTPELLWVRTPLPDPGFNAVVRTSLPEDRAVEMITAVRADFVQRNLPLLWISSPSTRPQNLGDLLVGQGFRHYRDDPGMALDLQRLPETLPWPAGLTIERVDDLDALRVWCSFAGDAAVKSALVELVGTIGFGAERSLYNYIGRLDGRPVATSTMVLGGGVAGIYNVMTIPEAQRRGIGTCMAAQPLYEARERGYRIGVLLSSPMGFQVYARLGFETYCQMGLYVWMNA